MIASAASVFGDAPDVEQKIGEAFRDAGNAKKVNDFLSGAAKRSHLFVYYQKPDAINDAGRNTSLCGGGGDVGRHRSIF